MSTSLRVSLIGSMVSWIQNNRTFHHRGHRGAQRNKLRVVQLDYLYQEAHCMNENRNRRTADMRMVEAPLRRVRMRKTMENITNLPKTRVNQPHIVGEPKLPPLLDGLSHHPVRSQGTANNPPGLGW